MRRTRFVQVVVLAATATAAVTTNGLAVTVPGTSNPWLAGMPNGTVSPPGDIAPDHSPVLVPGLCLRPGSALTFAATGGVANDPTFSLDAPDGNAAALVSHFSGAENGISQVTTPYNALVGVFLDASQPNTSPAPAALLFTTPASRDFLSLSPLLKQVFFIGDGKTSTNVVQQFIVPTGATRLYLATMDCCQWSNNIGSFTVDVFDPCPTPVGTRTWTGAKSLYR